MPVPISVAKATKNMPAGKGTYGSKRGRPAKKKAADAKAKGKKAPAKGAKKLPAFLKKKSTKK